MAEREVITGKPKALPCPTCGYLIAATQLEGETVRCSECGEEHVSTDVRRFYASAGAMTSKMYDRFVAAAVFAQVIPVVAVPLILGALASISMSEPSSALLGLLSAVCLLVLAGLWIELIRRASSEKPRAPISVCIGVHAVYFLAMLSILSFVIALTLVVTALGIVSVTRGTMGLFVAVLIAAAVVVLGVALWTISNLMENSLVRRCRRLESEAARAASAKHSEPPPSDAL
jgi:hypothetical protein